MGFDRKEEFRNSFKEDKKLNEAPKKCQNQGVVAHGRAPGSMAVLQRPEPHTTWRMTDCVLRHGCVPFDPHG